MGQARHLFLPDFGMDPNFIVFTVSSGTSSAETVSFEGLSETRSSAEIRRKLRERTRHLIFFKFFVMDSKIEERGRVLRVQALQVFVLHDRKLCRPTRPKTVYCPS